ncbi:Oidioi.mRNA.OKI2018_I69.chr2.g4500.t1.cds [Oikopleura dioica]|uniref:glycogenin glucosyltransferase n=1 Tax=Oikopleura dioica TaxID=34765 RepID=A0ABN7SXY5_OIKDI|nr:Oidioi.mRNA.OKI2018_I69.chr2.g4500.t1.cds [Oikopleura dioica]
MDDLIALNKELSALITELGGNPFSLTIVGDRVVLPEALRPKEANPNPYPTTPVTEPTAPQTNPSPSSPTTIPSSSVNNSVPSSASSSTNNSDPICPPPSQDTSSSSPSQTNNKSPENPSSPPVVPENSVIPSSSLQNPQDTQEAPKASKSVPDRFGFVTLATTDSYASGALVLARSLRNVETAAELVCLVSNNLTASSRAQLEEEFDEVIIVDVLNSNDDAMLALLKRPELGVTLTKLHCWKLTQFTKMVFLDADTLVLQNIDDLFQRNELSAVADCGWPSCFNSGVFVFKPSIDTFTALLDFANNQGSFDGGDQGLLNDFFSDWSTASTSKILPFGYNVHAAATYAYAPAFQKFKDQVKVVHFLGSTKPWTSRVAPQSEFASYWQLWWSLFETTDSTEISITQISEDEAQTPVDGSIKSGFALVQDALDAQMALGSSEPAPKFDIRI